MPILEGSLHARDDDGTVDVAAARRAGVVGPSIRSSTSRASRPRRSSTSPQAHGLKGANTYFAGDAPRRARRRSAAAFRAVRRGEVDIAVRRRLRRRASWWSMTKFDALGVLADGTSSARRRADPTTAAATGRCSARARRCSCSRSRPRGRARRARLRRGRRLRRRATTRHSLFTPQPAGPRLVARRCRRRCARRTRRRPTSTTSPRTAAARALGDATRGARDPRGLRRPARPAREQREAGDRATSSAAAGALNAARRRARRRAVAPCPRRSTSKSSTPRARASTGSRGAAREAQVGLALALARGFEGQNVALVLRAP